MRRKKVKALALALAITMLAQPVSYIVSSVPVQAAYMPDSMIETDVSKALEYLQQITDSFDATGTGQASLLSRLDDIQQYAMVLYYFEAYKTSLNLSGVASEDSELHQYGSQWFDLITRFNKFYGKKSDSFTKLKLSADSDKALKSDSELKKALLDVCTKQIPEYLDKILKDINTNSSSMTDDKKLSEYGVLLSNVCSVILNMEDMGLNLTDISPFKDKTSGVQYDFSNKMGLKTAYADLKKTYEDLLNVGQTVLNQKGGSSAIVIDPKLEFVANMANVTVQDGNVVIPDGVQLSQAYLAILAAGATYTPFSSYAGESTFREALGSLVSDEDTRKDLLDFYDDTKSFRKPLYKRSMSEAGKPTGKATLITIKDFLDDIQNGDEGALVTISGKFTYDSKNNYWVFADTYSTNQDEDILDSPDDDDFDDIADESLENSSVNADEAAQVVDQFNSANRNPDANVDNSSGSNDADSKKVTWAVSSTVGMKNSFDVKYSYGDGQCFVNYQFNHGNGTFYIIYKNGKTEKSTPKWIKTPNGRTYAEAIKKYEDDFKMPESYRLTNNDAAKEILERSASVDLFHNSAKDDFKELMTALSKNGVFSGAKADVKSESLLASLFQDVKAASVDTTISTDPTAGADTTTSTDPAAGENNSQTSSENSSEGSSENSSESSSENSSESSSGNSSTEANTSENETTTTSISTSEVSGMSVNSTDVVGIIADKSITSEDKMSEPILMYGARHARATDNLTTLLFRNIIAGTIGYEKMYNESNDYLYVNAYGDILTDDGMVLLPGIANPVMYSADAKYNPYTVAFMNYYPSVLANTSFFQVSSKTEIGKMLILNDSDGILDVASNVLDNTVDAVKNTATNVVNKITGNTSEKKSDTSILNPDVMITNKATSIVSKNDVKSTAPITMPDMERTFYYNEVEQKQLLDYSRLIFGDSTTWNDKNASMYAYTPLIIKRQIETNGMPVFPYNAEDDATLVDSSDNTVCACAKIIAQNMYHYLSKDTTGQVTNLGFLNDNYIVYYLCISNLNGSANPVAFANNDTDSYDRYVDNAQVRKDSTILQYSKKILNSLGKAEQVIGIKTSSQDSILGPIFAAIRERWLMALMLLVVILLFAFARMRRDALQSLLLLVICCFFAAVFVNVFPIYGPMAYNSVINNLSDTLAYKIMAVKAETNELDKVNVDDLDDDGNYRNKTTSITLYRVSRKDLQDFYDGLNISEKDVVGGKTYMINQEAGLFVEGDSIKMNTDVLFDTLEISGDYDVATNVYKLEARKTVSNSMDYYTPYYTFVNQLVSKVNDLAEVYSIPRTVTKYANGQLKDNYFIYSYVNSAPFLTPGSYDIAVPEDQSLFSSSDLSKFAAEQGELSKKMTEVFGDENQASDWLGIADFFYDLDPQYQQTIWAQTMYKNGYYYYDSTTGADWQPDREKINDLCNYVNVQTKKFVFGMDDQIGRLSDDVMLKIITMRELTAFTQYVSDIGRWLYPFTVNYQEMSLSDTLNCVIVDDYNTFVASNMDLCSYILTTYGWIHLILFDVIVIMLFAVSTVIHLAVSLMYLLLGALILIRIVKNDDIKVPLKGYVKCVLITMLCSTGLCFGVVIACKINASVVCLYFLLAIILLTALFLLTMLFSLVTNLADFGNTAINAKVSGITNNISSYRQKVTTANIFSRNHATTNVPAPQVRESLISRYSNNRSVDDFYDDYGYGGVPFDAGSGQYTEAYEDHDEDLMEEPEIVRESH